MSCTMTKAMVIQEFILCLVFKGVKAIYKLHDDLHKIFMWHHLRDWRDRGR